MMFNVNFSKYLIGGVSMVLIIQLWMNYNFDLYDILIIILSTILIMQLTDLIELKLLNRSRIKINNSLKLVKSNLTKINNSPKLVKSNLVKINNPPKLVKSNLVKINNPPKLIKSNLVKINNQSLLNKNKKVRFNNHVQILTSEGEIKIIPLAD